MVEVMLLFVNIKEVSWGLGDCLRQNGTTSHIYHLITLDVKVLCVVEMEKIRGKIKIPHFRTIGGVGVK